MKKIILILTVSFSLFSQEWVNISPFPDDSSGIQGDFISAHEGWVNKGTNLGTDIIYHTDDSGKNWEAIYTLEDSLGDVSFIEMIDSQNGWMKKVEQSKYDFYMKTSDGGYNWIDMTDHIPIKSDGDYPLYFLNKDIGFICVGIDSLDCSAMIYKTIDGGYNWFETITPALDYYGYNYPYGVYKFFFLDETYGWAACFGEWDEGLSICTTDGGESWLPGLPPEHNYLFDIHFINPNYGGTVGYFPTASSTEIILTGDNFNTIKYYHDENDWNQFAMAICFQNDSTVWVTGEPGIINRSTDGGATFNVYQTIDASLYKIQFFENVGYAFGYDNNALYKFDGSSGIEHEYLINDCVLYQNYPNPFNSETKIEYEIEKLSHVVIRIYNSKGEFIKNIVNERQNKGNYYVTFNGNNLNSGIYYYRLDIDGKVRAVNKMLYLK